MGSKIDEYRHEKGMGQIKSLPGVISATHVERKKYVLNPEGKLVSVPEYVIKIKFKKLPGIVVTREVVLSTHPDTLTLADYSFVVQNIYKDGK